MAQVAGVYQEKLLEQNMLDFDDTMPWSIRLLHEHDDVREKYQDQFEDLLVDEYQDTNLPQYVLIRQLANDRNNVFVVRDPDQAMYEWRGAIIEDIKQFEEDFEGARRIDLDTTCQSTKNEEDPRGGERAHPAEQVADRARDRTATQDRGRPVQMLTLTPTRVRTAVTITPVRRIADPEGFANAWRQAGTSVSSSSRSMPTAATTSSSRAREADRSS